MRASLWLWVLSQALSFGTAFAAPLPCKVPVCSVKEEVQRYKGMTPDGRSRALTELWKRHSESKDLSVWINLTEFAQSLSHLEEARKDASVLGQIGTIRREFGLKLLLNYDPDPEYLALFYREIRDLPLRRSVIIHWRGRIASFSDRGTLGKLVWLLYLFRSASDTQGDSWEILTEVRAAELEASERLKTLFPDKPGPGPGTEPGSTGPWDDTSCGLPVCHVSKVIDAFRAMFPGQRYTVSTQLRERYKDLTSVKDLEAVAAFGKELLTLFRVQGEQEWTVGQASGLMNDAFAALVRTAPLNAAKLTSYYRELQGEGSRFQALQHWRGQIAQFADRPSLDELLRLFSSLKSASISAGDPDYVAREAGQGEDDTRERIRVLSNPNQPPGPGPGPGPTPGPEDLTSCITESCELKSELDRYRRLSQGSRYLVLTRVRKAVEESFSPAFLANKAELGGALAELFLQIGEEDWMTREAQALKNDSLSALIRLGSPESDDLAAWYRGLRGETARYSALLTWRDRVEASNDRKVLEGLARFFAGAAATSEAEGDPEYLAREARGAEALVRSKL
jgi:hypothetical protein